MLFSFHIDVHKNSTNIRIDTDFLWLNRMLNGMYHYSNRVEIDIHCDVCNNGNHSNLMDKRKRVDQHYSTSHDTSVYRSIRMNNMKNRMKAHVHIDHHRNDCDMNNRIDSVD